MTQAAILGVIETDEVTEADEKAMIRFLGAFNRTRAGPEGVQALGLLLRPAPNAPIEGGVIGWSWYGWMHIAFVYLPENLRGAGLGRQLLQRAEAIARERGCRGLWLDTFSFQAPDFYRKLGYHEFGRLDGWPLGHSRYWMTKAL